MQYVITTFSVEKDRFKDTPMRHTDFSRQRALAKYKVFSANWSRAASPVRSTHSVCVRSRRGGAAWR